MTMNIWHDIDPKRISPDDFIAVIEIPKGCKVKYELDKETGLLKMDRILYTATHYAADNDPLDVLVLCSENVVPMTLMRCYPIGVIIMEDSGDMDEKIIAIPFGDPMYNSYKSISELPQHISDEMIHFFSVYKSLEGKSTALEEAHDVDKAKEIIKQCQQRYKDTFC